MVTIMILSIIPMILVAVGVPANIMTFIVFARKAKKISTHVYIKTLAVVDAFGCLASLPMFIYQMRFIDVPEQSRTICKWELFSSIFTHNCSFLLSGIICADRYKIISKPLRFHISITKSRILMVLSVIISFVMVIPFLVLVDRRHINEQPNHNMTKFCEFKIEGTFSKLIVTIDYVIKTCILAATLLFYWKLNCLIKKHTEIRDRTIHVGRTHMVSKRNAIEPIPQTLQSSTSGEDGSTDKSANMIQGNSLHLVSSRNDEDPSTSRQLTECANLFGNAYLPQGRDGKYVHNDYNNQKQKLSSRKALSSGSSTLWMSKIDEAETNNIQTINQLNVLRIPGSSKSKAFSHPEGDMTKQVVQCGVMCGMTKMLIATNVLLLLSWVLSGLGIMITVWKKYPMANWLVQSFHCILFLYHALNPLVYFTMNKSFRHDCTSLLKCKKCQ